jgi:hypothetical protein
MSTASLKRRLDAAKSKLASAGGGPPIIEVWTDPGFFDGPDEPDEKPRLLARYQNGRCLESYGWDGIGPGEAKPEP